MLRNVRGDDKRAYQILGKKRKEMGDFLLVSFLKVIS